MITQRRHGLRRFLAAGLAMLPMQASCAEALGPTPPWTVRITPQVAYVDYGGSQLRNDMTTAGIYFDAQYMDRGGIAGGATYTYLNLKQGIPAINQAEEFLSGRLDFMPELIPGRLRLRMDGHQINNNDSTNESNDVQVLAPQVSFLNDTQLLYLDLGYAISFYGQSKIDNNSQTVQQWTPTLGFGFNDKYDWMQLRLYDVSVSNSGRTLHVHRDAVEIKLTHYLAPQTVWIPYWLTVGGLIGNRIYAVDNDTEVVYNLADEQKGAAFLAAQWKLTEHYQATLSGGYQLFETKDIGVGNSYTYYGVNVYIGATAQW
jgi:hypothetical protein